MVRGPGRVRDAGRAPPSPLEHAFALGIGRGLRVLYQATLDGGSTAGTGDDDVLWMRLAPGSIAYGAAYEGYEGYEGYPAHEGHQSPGAGTLLVDPATWQGMVDQQYRLLHALDGWIEQLERDHEDRAAAGVEAGEAARTTADRTLLASIGRPGGPGARGRAGADATYAVCRAVADEARITLVEPADAGDAFGADPGCPDPVERIALASRIRTRGVRLGDRWWREDSGPWWVTARPTGHRSHCCGDAAGTWPSTRPRASGSASAGRARPRSRRAPSCSTARCPTGR